MWKQCGAGLLVLSQALGASPQVMCSLGAGASAYKASADQRPSRDTMQLVDRVNAAAKTICASTCPAVMVLRNTTAARVMFLADAGQGKLVYSPQFFASVQENYGDAGVIAIIAHEFGHALDDAMGAAWIRKNWTPELRADSWAGCALASIKLSGAEMQSALSALEKYPSPAHPGWGLRVTAIRAGYSGCAGDSSRFNSGSAGAARK